MREGASVSVLMPAYNHAPYVAGAIASVAAQTHRPVELIVIDDASTDATPDIIAASLAGLDLPVRFERGTVNRGVAAVLNAGLGLARGRYVSILASDDAYRPAFLARTVAVLEAAPDRPLVVTTNARLIDAAGRVQGEHLAATGLAPMEGAVFDRLAGGERFAVVPSTLVTARRTALAAGGFDPRLRAEDFDFHLRLARLAEFRYLAEPLFDSRGLPGSLGRRPWVWGEDVFTALEKHADRLGPRLPGLLQARAWAIAARCFEEGAPRHGLRYWRRGVGFGAVAPARALPALLAMAGPGLARALALGLLPQAAVAGIRAAKRRRRARRGG